MNKKTISILALTAVVFLGGCSEDRKSSGPIIVPTVPPETEPSLSPDGQFVYMAVDDTASGTQSGIFRARVEFPIRQHLHTVQGVGSPTVSTDGQRRAFLVDGTLQWYDTAQGLFVTPIISGQFETVCFVDSTQMIAGRDSSLYLVSVDLHEPVFHSYGWEPSFVQESAFVCVTRRESGGWNIVTVALDGSRGVIRSVTGQERPRYPDLDTTGNWLVYSLPVDSGYSIVVVDLSSGTTAGVAVSEFPKACIVSSTMILFTGPTGYLYQIDHDGGQAHPWLHVEEE